MSENGHDAARQGGFTLVELLVTTAIIVILTGIAFTGFTVYKESAYMRISEQLMHQARTALEAGKQDNEGAGTELVTVDQNTAGPLSDPVAQALMPGLVLTPHVRIYATYDPTCSDATCMQDYIMTRHCLTQKKVVYFRTFGGIESTTYNVDDSGPCS
ncbi:MAG: type II secretion system protein [Bdellovibrionota bacterium]